MTHTPTNTGVWSDQGRLIRSVKGASGDRMVDLVWHPVRRAIFSCGASGAIFSWAAVVTERWSVYVPTFTELDENEEYVEREDEFDFAEGEVPRTEGDALLPPPQKAPRVAPSATSTASSPPEHLDITTVEPLTAYFSGSEDESAEDRAPQLRTIMPELTAFIDQDALSLEDDEDEDGEEKEKDKDKDKENDSTLPGEDKKDSGTKPATTSPA